MAAPKPRDLSIGAFDDALLQRVLSTFGIDDFIVLPFFSLNGSIIDLHRRTETARKVFIETAGKVLFLKELPWYCSSIPFAAFSTRLHEHLGTQGIPVPTLRRTQHGEAFTFDRLSRGIFVLHEHLPGASWGATLEQAAAAGSALASLHRASATFPIEVGDQRRDVFTSSRELVELLHDASVGLDKRARVEVEGLAAESLHVINSCQERALSLGYADYAIPVHGDYNPFNLLFEATGQVCGIVDLDNACIDNPVHDLAEAVVRFCWMKYRGLSSAYGMVPSSFDEDGVRAIIVAYGAAMDLEQWLPYMADAATAVAIELGALGVLAGYYGPDDVPALRRNASSLRRLVGDVLWAVSAR